MLSLENFYWVMHHSLIRPCGLDTWYYYPFGNTDDSLIFVDNSISGSGSRAHVLFGFDQEPIWKQDLGRAYESLRPVWSWQFLKILANSEQSEAKKQLCKNRNMMDWYFFYHGFAALDWYRDSRYINHENYDLRSFLSLNNVVADQRCYRLDLISRLHDRGLDQKGRISLHVGLRQILHAITDNNKLTPSAKQRIKKTFFTQAELPWILDNPCVNGSSSARFGHREYELWQSCLFHIVNETVFYEPKLHLTEKVFQPIVTKRPFVLVAAAGSLSYLRSYGFRTFDKWIDESYDTIEDPDLRLEAIAEQIDKISDLSAHQLRELKQDMHSVLDHNKQLFFTDFHGMIVDELVDNFETCIRLWNNGRVNGREIPLAIDTLKVKQILKQ